MFFYDEIFAVEPLSGRIWAKSKIAITFTFTPKACWTRARTGEEVCNRPGRYLPSCNRKKVQFFTKASMLAEFFFALAIGSGMSCVP